LRSNLDSKVADIANVSGDRSAGMLIAGVFLREFVASGVEWVHIDVAGPAYNNGRPWGYTPKGATAVPLRTVLATLEEIADAG
jgi:leucyl aminopeptidase